MPDNDRKVIILGWPPNAAAAMAKVIRGSTMKECQIPKVQKADSERGESAILKLAEKTSEISVQQDSAGHCDLVYVCAPIDKARLHLCRLAPRGIAERVWFYPSAGKVGELQSLIAEIGSPGPGNMAKYFREICGRPVICPHMARGGTQGNEGEDGIAIAWNIMLIDDQIHGSGREKLEKIETAIPEACVQVRGTEFLCALLRGERGAIEELANADIDAIFLDLVFACLSCQPMMAFYVIRLQRREVQVKRSIPWF